MPCQAKTAGIILAAGSSTRFGRPKQLLKLKGKYLLEIVLNAALQSKLSHVVLVLGHEYQKILQTLGNCITHERLQLAINHHYLEGQSRSLKTGLLKIRHTFPAVMFLLGDQPMLDAKTIDHMLDKFRHSDKDICVPFCNGKRRNPVIFSRIFFNQLMGIEGDVGARYIIRANPNRVLHVKMENPLCFVDIDTKKDFKNLQRLLD